jgi:Fic family protein
MTYTPSFTITSKILSAVGQIDVAREIITTAPLIPAWERRFQKEARAKIIHHGTHLEGNDLNLEEVEQVLSEGDAEDGKTQVVGRDRDIQEVINYRSVMEYIDAVEQTGKTADLRLTEAMLLEIHRLTVTGLLPVIEAGHYRSVKVVIRNTTTGEITFRPPSPVEIPFHMQAFFAWLSSPEGRAIHPLLRAGILHYELVRIHPFTDGNGRTARAMALLLLFLEGYEVKKFFSLEEYYDAHPQQYYDALKSVELKSGDVTDWLEYFLEGIAIEFSRVKNLVQKLSLDLHLKATIGGHQITLSDRQIKLVEYLERYGEVSMVNARSLLPNVSDDTVLRDLRDLVTKKLLVKKGTTKGTKYYLKN